MKSSPSSAWLLSVGLLVLGACKSDGDDKPAADPLADPWVDAIETGADEPAVIAEREPLPGGQDSASIAEARPPAAELAMPIVDEAEPTTANSPAPAAPRNWTAAAAVHEAPAIDEQPAEPAPEPASAPEPAAAPEPVVEPKSAPSAEPSPAPITSADFHGSWRYVGGKAQRDDVTAAIE